MFYYFPLSTLHPIPLSEYLCSETRRTQWTSVPKFKSSTLSLHFSLLMETIPVKNDEDSDGNSMPFHTTNRRQFGQNPHRIPWQFHVIYSGFICFPCWIMTWILDKFKSWNFHGICQENDGISSGFGLIFEPNETAVKKTWENTKCHIFYGVIIIFILRHELILCSQFHYVPKDTEEFH